jgi:hypothetical protein
MWRVFCRQWLVYSTSMELGEAGVAECQALFDERYRGLVEAQDWRITRPEAAYGRSFLELCVPNCCGEYPERIAAEHRAGQHGGHPHQVVEHGSSEEERLLSYGKRRLHAGSGG